MHRGLPTGPYARPFLALLLTGLALQFFGGNVQGRASGGAVVAWGDSQSGEVGSGAPRSLALTASQVSTLSSGVTAIAAGAAHSLAVLDDGTVVAWGADYAGQLGDGGFQDQVKPVSVQGLTGVGCPLGAVSTCVPIAAGVAHSLALRTDGTVQAWGENNWGQLGNGGATASSIPVGVAALTGMHVVAIAAGGAHSLALLSDGTVMAWGDNADGQLGLGTADNTPHPAPTKIPGLSNVVAIAAGDAHSLAVLSGGSVVAWGNGFSGQLGNGATSGSPTPVAVSGLVGVVSVSAGLSHSVALTSSGQVMAWGRNSEGQLGDGTTTNRSAPVAVLGLPSGVSSVEAGGLMTLALRSDGKVDAWGDNDLGQLGDGMSSKVPSPVPSVVGGVSAAVAIAAGGGHALALQPEPDTAQSAGTFPAGPVAPTVLAAPSPPGPASLGNSLASPPDVTGFGVPSVAADPAHPGHLAVAFTDFGNCWLALSADSGATWTSKEIVNGVFGFPTASTGAQYVGCGFSSASTVAYSSDGTLFYGLSPADARGGSSSIFLTASTDGGATFLPLQQLDLDAVSPTDPSGGTNDDSPALAFDTTAGPNKGTLYVAWRRSTQPPAFRSGVERVTTCSSTQLGAYVQSGHLTCAPAVTVSFADVSKQFSHSIAVGADGRVSVGWIQDDDGDIAANISGPFSLYVVSSTDGGHSFSSPTQVDVAPEVCPDFTCLGPAFGQAEGVFFQLAAGGNTGQLYAVVSGPRADGRSRVVFAASSDGGASWPTRREFSPVSAGNEQHTPGIGVAANGRIDIAYYEMAATGSENVYLVSSTDGGASFSSPITLSNQPSDENIVGAVLGDGTLGVAETTNAVEVAWCDSRRGTVDNLKTDIAVAAVPEAATIGTNPPLLPATGREASAPGLLGVTAGVIVSLFACAMVARRRRVSGMGGDARARQSPRER